ncbi:DUF2799 domain-containing protein [Variovorax terrae]|uniref:DUF2799 domain-containing protein n=1 Tax=Variovorax terrae TaxID=2923278 RepID=A0A9X1VUC9_9BURK|nr:DUF2799 domain-containing protein [Variovorax terrae]MCJ0762209.1 DUF2799 domain-containing protein [Variovorax terrae]
MRIFRFLFAALVLAGLSACTTMSPSECKLANWYDVGLRDGLAGEPLSQLDSRTKDCAEAGVPVNTVPYLQGRDQGLQSFCQLDNAVKLGLDGRSYNGVCPAFIDGEFRRRRDLGYEVYSARGQLRSLESRRRELEKKLRDAANDDDRRKAREELSDLDQRFRRARDRQRDAEWALDRLR